MGQFALGQSVPRTEDPRLLDRARPLHRRFRPAAPVPRLCPALAARPCPYPRHRHARARSRCRACWRCSPAPIGRQRNYGSFRARHPAQAPRRLADGTYRRARRSRIDRAMLVGDPVAFIVAETRRPRQGRGRAHRRRLRAAAALTATDKARTPQAAKLWADCPDNESFFYTIGDKPAVDAAFAAAHHVTRLKMVFNRITAARWSRAAASPITTTGSSAIHSMSARSARMARAPTGAPCLQHCRDAVRIVAGDVGGSFGMKGSHFPEYQLALWASGSSRRPVKWISERSEGMLSDDHDRDHIADGRVGARQGRQVPGDARLPSLEYRRLSRARRRHLADRASGRARRHLYDAGDLCRGVGGVLQHHQHRPVPRLGPARGVLYLERAHRQRRARDGHRPRRAAPPQHRAGERDAVQDRARLYARQRRVREESRHGTAYGRTTPTSSAAAPRRKRAAACAASASPTSSSRPRRRMGETVMVKFDPGRHGDRDPRLDLAWPGP